MKLRTREKVERNEISINFSKIISSARKIGEKGIPDNKMKQIKKLLAWKGNSVPKA